MDAPDYKRAPQAEVLAASPALQEMVRTIRSINGPGITNKDYRRVISALRKLDRVERLCSIDLVGKNDLNLTLNTPMDRRRISYLDVMNASEKRPELSTSEQDRQWLRLLILRVDFLDTSFASIYLRRTPCLYNADHLRERILSRSGAVTDFRSDVLADVGFSLGFGIILPDAPGIPSINGRPLVYLPETREKSFGLSVGEAHPVEQALFQPLIGVSAERETVLNEISPVMSVPSDPIEAAIASQFHNPHETFPQARRLVFSRQRMKITDTAPSAQISHEIVLRTYFDRRDMSGPKQKVAAELHGLWRKPGTPEAVAILYALYGLGEGMGYASPIVTPKERMLVKVFLGRLHTIVTSKTWRDVGLRFLENREQERAVKAQPQPMPASAA